MKPRNRKVLVALRMAGIAGQEKLAGVFRFLDTRRDWDITLVRTAAEFTPASMRAALDAGCDGVLVSIPDTGKTADILAASSVPTVVMDIHDTALLARTENIAFIHNSPDEIGRVAADHLLSTGRCRSYAFVHNTFTKAWSADRVKTFRAVLRDRGFWCHEMDDPDGLARLEKPIGVLAANDDRGYDVLEFCRARHLRVPDDALVLGINNDTLVCENALPRLSSIQPDYEREGFLAAETLDRLMRGRPTHKPTTALVGVKAVVRRESTAETSPAGKLVQKAVAYLNRYALTGITVDDVVRHLGCSRRLADLRFRQLQGASIGQTIITMRLAEAKRRLATTDEPLDVLAQACGYENPNSLKNLFKHRYGITLSEWRRRNRG